MTPVAKQQQPLGHAGLMEFVIGSDDRVLLPGLPAGLAFSDYLALFQSYAAMLEARRILDRYRPLLSQVDTASFQSPLTPLQHSNQVSNLCYKREDLTVTRAYKVRGAVVCMAKAMETTECRRFLAVSTGNHALGVLKAAELLKPDSVRIVVPLSTVTHKVERMNEQIAILHQLGVDAEVEFAGQTFDEARAWAMNQTEGEYYIDPYSDPWVVAGQGTIGLELVEQLAPLVEHAPLEEVVVVSPVGGGGLMSGLATALKLASAWDQRFRSVNVRLLGLKLADLNSVEGDAIRVQEIASVNQMRFSALGIELMDVDDSQMCQGREFVLADIGAEVEGASGGTLMPLLHQPAWQPNAQRLVVCVLSGGNVHH